MEERNRILDEYYRSLVDQVAKVPAEGGYDVVTHFIAVAKNCAIYACPIHTAFYSGKTILLENANKLPSNAIRNVFKPVMGLELI